MNTFSSDSTIYEYEILRGDFFLVRSRITHTRENWRIDQCLIGMHGFFSKNNQVAVILKYFRDIWLKSIYENESNTQKKISVIALTCQQTSWVFLSEVMVREISSINSCISYCRIRHITTDAKQVTHSQTSKPYSKWFTLRH